MHFSRGGYYDYVHPTERVEITIKDETATIRSIDPSELQRNFGERQKRADEAAQQSKNGAKIVDAMRK